MRRIRQFFKLIHKFGFKQTIHLSIDRSIKRKQLLSYNANDTKKFRLKKDKSLSTNIDKNLDKLKETVLPHLHERCSTPSNEYKWLDLSAENEAQLVQSIETNKEVKIADVDQDGYYLSYFGSIAKLPCTDSDGFLNRNRFKISLVCMKGHLCIKKEFLSDKKSFFREVLALHLLEKHRCNVPRILTVDFDSLSLTVALIKGRVLRHVLVEKGAKIEDRNFIDYDGTKYLTDEPSFIEKVRLGRQYLSEVLQDQIIEALYRTLQKIHEARVILNDIKYGNFIIEEQSSNIYLVDFDMAEYYPKISQVKFNKMKDVDISLFNEHFLKSKLTHETIAAKLKKENSSEWYAPVYFGFGLGIGNYNSVDSGYGRWHYLLKNVLPELSGMRILDLGANNGTNALQLLKNGAKEVVCIENDEKFIAQGRFIQEACEWVDNSTYNLQYIKANMTDLPDIDLGKFSMVIALCSIYYLEEEQIYKLIRYIRTITNTMVLQANHQTNIGRKDEDTYRKASAGFARNILVQSGFCKIKITTRKGYERPLIIGHAG